MMKMYVKNEKYIKDNHKEYLKQKVINRINQQMTKSGNKAYLPWLKNLFYDDKNILDEAFIELLLVGRLEDITNDKRVINHHMNVRKLVEFESAHKSIPTFGSGNGRVKKRTAWIVNVLNEYETVTYDFIRGAERFSIGVKVKKSAIDTSKFGKAEDYKRHVRSVLSKVPIRWSGLQKILESIFNYQSFCSEPYWNRHRVITLMDVQVCPYCNRQYVSSYFEKGSSGKELTTSDLDHYYSKSIYPHLSLSYYNFVPSCQLCNSRFKNDDDFLLNEHLYPHHEGFEDHVTFDIDINKSGDFAALLGINTNYEVVMKSGRCSLDFQKKIDNSIRTFRLRELYNTHKSYISDLLYKIHKYNEAQLDGLCEIEGLFENESEIERFVFGNQNDKEEMVNQSLSKLTQDILERYKLW